MLKVLKWLVVGLVALVLISRLFIPNVEFQAPTSTVALDTNGYLLGAKIASDGQWRFPPMDSVPEKFKTCITLFEDQYFDYHFGINPVSIFRALRVNFREGRIAQGGSTLTMQIARMVGERNSRSFFQKLKELFIALHLEVNNSKSELLNMYSSNAPFGGNVVGLNAAAWRYYGRSAYELSWAEYAVLAVLPNAPSLIYPGKNEHRLKVKRDKLLDKLREEGDIDQETCELSKLESLPLKPFPLPNFAYHLLDRVNASYPGQSTVTSIDQYTQQQAQSIINRQAAQLGNNEVNNAAAIIIDVKTNQILAYVGNATHTWNHNNAVDVVKANRSTGSLLKPFLYSAALTSGELLPEMLLPDIPTYISGYSPKNYYLNYDGAVRANEALYRSLNVPFVRLLQNYGVDRFYSSLTKLHMSSLAYGSDHYGLSLILGGAEGKLIEMSSMYASMARVLTQYNQTFDYSSSDYQIANYTTPLEKGIRDGKFIYSAAAIHSTFNALLKVNRPISEAGWKQFSSSRKIAWKTGTSFGNKDAWAIGVAPEYVVGVWVGNADGEGRTGLTGVSSAAPIMFELFEALPASSWFQEPFEDLQETEICTKSGYRASQYCEEVTLQRIPVVNKKLENCPYHHLVHVTKDNKYRVNMDCELASNIDHVKWFTLPPAQEWYYKRKSPLYRMLPPLRADCNTDNSTTMEFIYPKNTNKVFIPIQLDGTRGEVVFELAHRNSTSKVFWHLDGEYLGYTQDFHEQSITTDKGWHQLIVVDEQGNELVKSFEVLSD